MEKKFLSTTETAQLIGLSKFTLINWRVKKVGIPYRKFGKRVLYEITDILAYAGRNQIQVN